MQTVWARQGQPVLLKCPIHVNESNNYALEWRREGSLIFNAFGNETGHTAPSMQGRVVRSKSLGLTIHAVTVNDQSTYQCLVTNFSNVIQTVVEHGPAVKLMVRVPPKITFPSHDVNELFVSENKDLRVSCESNGFPPPEVTWTKNGRIVSRTKWLEIQHVSLSDTGVYSCQATNSEGTDEFQIDLQLRHQPVLDYELSNKTVIEGGNVVWRCSAHGKPSKITYHWSKEGMSINTLDLAQRAHIQNGEFGIINVKRTDSGFYECEAGNGENAVKTRAYLNVLYKPELRSRNSDIVVLAEGRKENIECSMDANPTVLQIFWLKNGLPIQPDKSADFQNDTIAETFTIQNASHSDAGLWSCWAQNVVGRSEVYEFHVMIATAPTFSHEPPAETKIDVGSSISVDCAGIGDPPPTQYWLRNMRKITGSRLNILNASYSDHGLYQCVLSNSVVSSVRNFTLFVEKVPPQCSEDINVKCDGESGFNFEFRPGYSSDNEQVFRVLYTPLNDSDTKSLSNNEHVIWQSSEKNSNPFFTIEHLIPFSKYRFLIETSNVFGSVNCSAGEHHVCSVLDSPRNLRVNENKELEWDSVDMANNYRVSYRLSNEKSFNNFNDTNENSMSIRQIESTDPIDFHVQSLRSPFVPSKPSEIFTYRTDLTASYNHNYTFFSIFVLLVLIFGVFLTKKRFRTKRSNRDSTSRILPSDNQPPTMFEEDWKALWLTQSEYADSNSDVADDCMFDSIYCSPHVVKSVLQEKYIYSKKNSTLERMREDLHIERLRNEMNQSVL